MKKLAKIVGSILLGLVVILVILRFTGFQPADAPPFNRSWSAKVPGLWLRGKPVTGPVTDWSFTDKIRRIMIQTETPYLLPHSVTIWCVVYNGNLYLSSYRGRLWVEDILRDPHVRLKIAGRLYDRTVSVITDPAVKAAVLQAKGKKYPDWKVPAVSTATVFLVNPQ